MKSSSHPTTDDRYLRLAELAEYASLSVRTLQRCIADPVHPLPAHRALGRTVLVLRSDFDRWLREHRATASSVDFGALSDDDRRILSERAGYAITKSGK
jgi:excisionase family DNA binding protein